MGQRKERTELQCMNVSFSFFSPEVDMLSRQPLHTWAKSRDRGNCESPKERVSKGRPKTLVVGSSTLKCSVKPYVAGLSTKCCFNEFCFMQVLTHDKKERIKVRLWAFGVPWSPGFALGLPPRGGFESSSSDHGTWSISMPCRNPCRLDIHLAFTYSIGPSCVVWSELGPAPPFPPMRVFKM